MTSPRDDVVERLALGREQATDEWPSLVAAFDHAIALALEAQYESNRAAQEAMMAVQPCYPPLVNLLAYACPTSTDARMERNRKHMERLDRHLTIKKDRSNPI